MLRAEFLCSISRQYLLGWEKMEMPSDTSVAEGENLQCLQDFLRALQKFLQALQIFVDARSGFCGTLGCCESPSFGGLSIINDAKKGVSV